MQANLGNIFKNLEGSIVKGNKWYSTKTRGGGEVDSAAQSLSNKGFLRSHKPYAPSENVAEKIKNICLSLQLSNEPKYKLENLNEKFRFLDLCFKDFKHSVPNSKVHELETIGKIYVYQCSSGDVIRFYKTPVNTTVPYDALKQVKLPENLHIQYDYLRFHSETDTKFNGQTAFPKSSTLVTGLKYRGKYEGYEAKRSWP
uniref:Large ribosomal subunit protein mL50 n=1 Tax=Glossina brevipalpis TaxID=37001 RepID=A0A1A9W5R8_9MUSC